MRRLLIIAGFLLLVPLSAYAAKLIITVPQEVSEVKLLSPGTQAVLDHLKGRLNSQMKAVSDRCQISRLEADLKASNLHAASSEKAYTDKIDALRKQYIARVPITIHSAVAQITSESALGEINFTYTVQNRTDKIISDIIYKPMIDKTPLPITTMLVLEFINSKSLIYGLAPGESLTNQGNDPEHLSFFLSELKDKDINRIKNAMPGGFTIEVTDIHFVSQKGYKGQTKVMDMKEAFADVLREYQNASRIAREDSKAKAEALANARSLYQRETRVYMNDFMSRSRELKRASVRYQGSVKPKKDRVTIESIKPGRYYAYAKSASGKAFFREVIIEEGKNKLKFDTPRKDPFEP